MRILLKVNRNDFASIQILRGLAAISVCIAHALTEAQYFSPIRLDEQFPWGIGVDVFFIISGFIMMYTTAHNFGVRGASVNFAVRRLIRIVPTYWFFTTLMLISILFFPSALHTARYSLSHVILSYFFIPHLEPGSTTTIHPLLGLGWTLIYEMFFYLMFSLALLFSRNKGILFLIICFSALYATARMGVWPPALNIFWSDSVMFEFLFGIFAYLIIVTKEPRKYRLLTCFIFLIILAWLVSSTNLTDARVFTYGLPALALFLFFVSLPNSLMSALGILVLIGDASYTLYLCHPFLIKITKALLLAIRLHIPGELSFFLLFVASSAVLSAIAATVFYVFLEAPFQKLLNKLLLRKGTVVLTNDTPKVSP